MTWRTLPFAEGLMRHRIKQSPLQPSVWIVAFDAGATTGFDRKMTGDKILVDRMTVAAELPDIAIQHAGYVRTVR